MVSLRILLILTLSIVTNAQYFFPAIPFVTGARDPDPVRGSSAFAIQYTEGNNNKAANTQEIILEKPAGDPNLPARIDYTMTWTITPASNSVSEDLRLNVTTKTLGRGTLLIDENSALTNTADSNAPVSGTITGSETVRLGGQFVISVNSTDPVTTIASAGTFSGNVEYTMAVLDDAKTSGGLWFFGILLTSLATVTGVVIYNEKESH